MSDRWHIFYQPDYECPQHQAFDTKEQLELFLADTNWGGGAIVWAIVRGVELDMKPRQVVEAWEVFEKDGGR